MARRLSAIAAFAAFALFSTLVSADPLPLNPFTGPISPFYVQNFATRQIEVAQGNSVVNSFNSNYGFGIAISGGTVRTHGENSGPGTSGAQYSLSGVPTGVTYTYPTPAGLQYDNSADGTTDGTHNYYVQYYGYTNDNNYVEDVIQTDTDWKNPVSLFSVAPYPGACCQDVGIAYDATNNSLWVSGWGAQTISDYSLNGDLLSSFVTPGIYNKGALGVDPADHTLWFVIEQGAGAAGLYQYSTDGTLLQWGTPAGMDISYVNAADFQEFGASESSSVPEPSTLLLAGSGLLALARRLRKSLPR